MSRADRSTGGEGSPKESVERRLSEAGITTDRFIDVRDGGKASTDHTQVEAPDVSGNYGVYAGRGLVLIDIDDYDGSHDLGPIDGLQDTLTVATPNGGEHRYYHVENASAVFTDAFGVENPKTEWGEIRVRNQYVVGPGSTNPDGDVRTEYTIATDVPIAQVSASDVVRALRACGYDTADETAESAGTAPPSEPLDLSDEQLLGKARNAENGRDFEALWNGRTAGYPSHSEADLALCNRLAFWTGGDRSRIDRLFRQSGLYRDKWERDDYRERTISKALEGRTDYYEPDSRDRDSRNTTEEPGDGGIVPKFSTACERYQINPHAVATEAVDGEQMTVGVRSIVADLPIEDSVFAFKRHANLLDGEEKQAVIGYVILLDLQDRGEFFTTPGRGLYYFYEPETQVYRVDASGRRVLTEDFQGLVWERYNLFAGTFSRNLGEDIKSQARRNAPERDVYRFAHYDSDAGELYVNDFGDGYYSVTPDSVEWRANGTDVFFLPANRAEAFEYVEPSDRPELPDELPGERPLWCGSGDALMRLFGNRINYDESAALAPADQRTQLYLHLHTLPFIDELNARPIMAWVGEKGSGKTVLQRSIGRFVYGDGFTESVMPDSKDDFLAKVSNQALAFLDNYDDGVDWANDILAAVATGAGIDQRELYTTNSLRQEVPRCWLSLTSRDPPFRRDDVADRTLVFRVERVEDGFVGMGDYLHQVTEYRNVLWSVYLDNLQAIVREHQERDTGSMSSGHRMAGWAIFARIVGDALGVDAVDDLLETMETERATFALENESWAAVIGRWLKSKPETAAKWHTAGELGDLLESFAGENDLPIDVTHAAGLGSKLTTYRNELGELYGLEIDDGGRSNQYRFVTDDDHEPTGLGRF